MSVGICFVVQKNSARDKASAAVPIFKSSHIYDQHRSIREKDDGMMDGTVLLSNVGRSLLSGSSRLGLAPL
jgi:hypothetical protein